MSSSEQEQKPADADIGWAELKATEGDTYRAKASDYDMSTIPETEANQVAASGPSFTNVAVNWRTGTVGGTGNVISRKTSITWYKLSKTPWYNVVYDYELEFIPDDSYNFGFTDGTGDCYWVNVWSTGSSHYVQFNSSNPTIVQIQGS